MKRYLIFGLALAGCSGSGPKQDFAMPPAPVSTAAVEVRDVPLYFEAMGVIKSARTAEVKPQVTGMIKEVHFTEGEWVKEGTLLYTIDEAPYAIRALEMQAQLQQDLAHLTNAKKKLDRYKSLRKQDLIAAVEWDELETQIALREAMVQADESRLAAAKLDLQHCRITAPISGFAGKSTLSVGNMVGGGTLVTLTQSDPLQVDFTITENELQKITTHSPEVKVYMSGNDNCVAFGKVTFLDHAIDPKSGLLAATAVLKDEHKPLWPGQSVRVHLYFGKKEMAKLIPMRAVKTNEEGPYIFTVKEDSTVELRPIKLGFEEKGLVIVEEGLDGANKVVTEGHLRLFPGSKVEEVR
ncbi:MAG: efflux RND transporter periplasmic adaptor subunit [Candidatus Melainabacteria bacterium]|nr:efflux RND transporter periplasmic adaptor subunit [Candidatus Melainabacteria bacterium]